MTTILRHQKYAIIMIYSPNFATSLKETDILFHCVCYIEPVYNTDMVSIPQKANEVQFEFPTKMLGKKVVDNAMILRFFPNFVDSSYTNKERPVSNPAAGNPLNLVPAPSQRKQSIWIPQKTLDRVSITQLGQCFHANFDVDVHNHKI